MPENEIMMQRFLARKILPLLPVLAACFITIAGTAQGDAGQNGESTVWPQSRSDLKADPAVLFGTLPNGMRYAILKNATPAGQAALRLRIGSGSLEESDAQQGLAHFLEHMAFKGSTHVPEGEMVKILQRKGLAFGPDTNASTGWTQTVYMLDLPEADPGSIDTGLMLLREIASELILSAKAMEPERGVVQSEERLRDTPQHRTNVARLAMLLDGQLAARRFPIGKVDVVRNAPQGLIADYYRANYRPDRAALLMAGDFEPSGIEERIKALFSDWYAAGAAASEPDLGKVRPRGLTAKLVELPGSETRIEIAWVRPYDDAPDTLAKRRAEMIDGLGLAVLRRRLSRLAQGENPPFLSAGASFGNVLRSAKVASVTTVSTPGGWQRALAAIEQEQRRIVQYGVRQDELGREVTEYRTRLEQAAAGATTRRTKDLASVLVESVDQNKVFTSPADSLARFERVVKDLSAADVSAVLGRIFEGAGPLVQMSTSVPVEGGDRALAAEYAKARQAAVSAPAAEAAINWPYESFGPAGTIAQRADIPDLGAVSAHFANGVRLTVKPTQFHAGDVLVTVRIGNGRLDLSKDAPVWLTQAFVAGGLKAINEQDMARALASRLYSAQFSVTDDAFVFEGRTRSQDFAVQLQVLAAYITDAAYRQSAIERARAQELALLAQMEATPAGVDARDRERLLHAGDARWGQPGREELEAAKAESLKVMLQGPLSAGAVEVTVVGDISADAAINAVAATLGALPPRPAPGPRAGALAIAFPAPAAVPVERTHKGRTDASMAFMAWPVGGIFADVPRSRTLVLAADVLKDRLISQVRMAEGMTYSPQAGVQLSYTFPDYGYAWCKVETPPDKIAHFYTSVAQITSGMAANGVTADELARAKTPLIERVRKAELSNEYWLQTLSGTQADPRKLDLVRTRISGYEAVTAGDIERVVEAYITGGRAWKLVVMPASK
jgi:zinc protease